MSDHITSSESSIPRSDDAEKGLLCCFLQTPDLLDDAHSTIPPELFYNVAHRLIYEELLVMNSGEVPIDTVTFIQHLIDRALLEKCGGPGFMGELTNFIPTAAHYPHYRSILRNQYLLRRIIQAGAEFQNLAMEHREAPREAMDKAEASLFQIIELADDFAARKAGLRAASETLDSWTDYMSEIIKNKGEITGIPTGLNDLDRTLHGLQDGEGELMVIAARPGMGKTALATTLLRNIALDCRMPTAFFPIEMGTNRTWDRIILGSNDIDTSKANTGMFSREEYRRMMDFVSSTYDAPFYMNGEPSLSTAELRQQVKAAKKKHGIRCLVIDYLSLVSPVTKEGQEQERLAIKEVMQTCHYLKRHFKLAIILLVQAARDTDRNQGKPPVLADLAGSSEIERYADHIIFIHRPAYYTAWHHLKPKQRLEFWMHAAVQRAEHPELWSDGLLYADEYSGSYSAAKSTTATDETDPFGTDDDTSSTNPDEATKQLAKKQGTTIDLAKCREDWEQHALLYVRKNRRGPTPELWVRYMAQHTRFESRTPKLFSNNVGERQV